MVNINIAFTRIQQLWYLARTLHSEVSSGVQVPKLIVESYITNALPNRTRLFIVVIIR